MAKPERHEVVVTVNEQAVKLHGKTATGAEIKAAAIKQGAHIQQNFVLQEELPNGMSRIIGDAASCTCVNISGSQLSLPTTTLNEAAT